MTMKFDGGDVQTAADAGDVRAMLVATRSRLAHELDRAGTSASSVAAVAKQLVDVQARIDALDKTGTR